MDRPPFSLHRISGAHAGLGDRVIVGIRSANMRAFFSLTGEPTLTLLLLA